MLLRVVLYYLASFKSFERTLQAFTRMLFILSHTCTLQVRSRWKWIQVRNLSKYFASKILVFSPNLSYSLTFEWNSSPLGFINASINSLSLLSFLSFIHEKHSLWCVLFTLFVTCFYNFSTCFFLFLSVLEFFTNLSSLQTLLFIYQLLWRL